MNNINLYESLENHNKSSNLLKSVEIKELKRERLNEFYKTFREVTMNVNKEFQFKTVIKQFKELPTSEKLQHKRISKRIVQKYIHQIYTEYRNLSKEPSTSSGQRIDNASGDRGTAPLMDAIFKQISINYGNVSVTDLRMFRLFASVLFNSVAHDQRVELEKALFV